MTANISELGYPTFAKGETIEVEFLNKTIIGKFNRRINYSFDYGLFKTPNYNFKSFIK